MANAPFLDLFHHLRQAGMPLAPDQYDLLRQALDRGYGLNGWDDLRRLCRLLWVKPCPNYDAEVFDQAFDRYVRQLHSQWQRELDISALSDQDQAQETGRDRLPSVPRVPPRWQTEPQAEKAQSPEATEVPIALKTPPPEYPPIQESQFQLMPTRMPVPMEMVRSSWKTLRQSVREGQDYELDVEGTIDRINQNGLFSEVVLRPCLVQRAELLVLIDDSDAMIPFNPVLQPFITAVTENRISPSQLYRFTVFPEGSLYQWHQATTAVPLAPLLSRLHRSRTVVWIISDGGAATAMYNAERLHGIVEFLTQLAPCVRELLWFNPLPPDRWQLTTAAAIAQILDGRMLTLDPFSLQQAARQPLTSPVLNLWLNLWSLS
jgi:uncharacterized protein